MAKPKPYKIAVGVRYQPNFALQDVLGTIVQAIVRDRESPFGGIFHQVIEESPSRQRIIKCEKSNTYIKISNTDFVYEYFFENDVETAFASMMSTALPYLLEVIIKRHKIGEINRVGIIFGFQGDLREISDKVTNEITGGTVSSSDDFILRFSRKLVDSKALAMEKIQDFKNIIVTLQHPQSKPMYTLDLDFQHYFVPDLEHSGDFDFVDFCKKAKERIWADFPRLLSDGAAKAA